MKNASVTEINYRVCLVKKASSGQFIDILEERI